MFGTIKLTFQIVLLLLFAIGCDGRHGNQGESHHRICKNLRILIAENISRKSNPNYSEKIDGHNLGNFLAFYRRGTDGVSCTEERNFIEIDPSAPVLTPKL